MGLFQWGECLCEDCNLVSQFQYFLPGSVAVVARDMNRFGLEGTVTLKGRSFLLSKFVQFLADDSQSLFRFLVPNPIDKILPVRFVFGTRMWIGRA